MFCVFGRSRPIAKKRIEKLMTNCFSEISAKLQKYDQLTQEAKQLIIDKFINDEFESMKPKKCTHEFSAPEFSKEAYALMKVDNYNFSDLTLMKKVKKTKGVIHSKKTGRQLLEWVKLNG